jgi:hypothetical protein
MATDSPLHRMMSQGINVVVAKSLLDLESKCDEKVALMESNWNKKLCSVQSDYEERINNQNLEIQSMKAELFAANEMIDNPEHSIVPHHRNVRAISDDVAAMRQTMECTFDEINTNVQTLAGNIKKILEKVLHQEKVTSTIQDNIEDFLRVYESRSNVVDFVITQHENGLKTTRDAIGDVDRQTKLVSSDMIEIKDVFDRKMQLLQAKLEVYKEASTERDDVNVSVDEHNQLRLDLEDQIMECNMKYDHVLLTVQQQWEEYKHRSDELEVLKGVAIRAKKRREVTLQEIRTKHNVLTQIIEDENECKVSEVMEDLGAEDHVCKDSNIYRDEFKAEIHEPEYDDESENIYIHRETIQPCIECNIRYENEDNDSEFGNSINLVLLDEISIH